MNLPIGWSRVELGEAVAKTQLGGNYVGSSTEPGVPMMKMGNMERGRFNVEKFERIAPDTALNPRDYLKSGDLILNTRNSLDLVGKVALWRRELAEAVFNSNMMRVVPNFAKIASTAFLNYLLNSEAKLRQIRRRATGTTSVAAIYWRDLESLTLILPSLPEQQKIADILNAWDEALEKLDALIAAKNSRNQALVRGLITGQRRLQGYSKQWTKQRFGELMRTEDRYVTFDDDHLYRLVSARRRAEGVFFREALHGRDIKTKVMKQVRAGDFVISRMQVVHGGLGVVPPECDGFYASDSYEVLVPRDLAKLSPRFIGHLCRTRRFWHHALVCSHGVHIEKMTFVMSDFEHEKLLIPEFAEQTAIADVLDAADAELRLLRGQRAALDQQKRGLMQRLLTGKVRVFP